MAELLQRYTFEKGAYYGAGTSHDEAENQFKNGGKAQWAQMN